MSDKQIFKSALAFVHGALEARATAGLSMKAPLSRLDQLCSPSTGSTRAPRGEVPQQSPETIAKTSLIQVGLKTSASHDTKATPSTHQKRDDIVPFPVLPQFTDGLSADARLQAFSEKAAVCFLCPQLADARKNVVFGEGSCRAELMFVCEAPGIDEDREGKPFAGDAGVLFHKMLTAMGMTLDEVYLTSALKCRPHVSEDLNASRPAARDELQQCAPYLAAQIAIIRPKVIVVMGAEAMRALFGTTDTVGKLRSHWHSLQGIPVMPTFHPRYLIRNQSNSHKRKVWEDLLQVLERLGRTVTEKQRGYFKPRAES